MSVNERATRIHIAKSRSRRLNAIINAAASHALPRRADSRGRTRSAPNVRAIISDNADDNFARTLFSLIITRGSDSARRDATLLSAEG